MADVGFYRADDARFVRRAVSRDDGTNGARFQRIANGGAGPVSLYILDLLRRDPRALVGQAHSSLLGFRVWDRNAVGMPILGHSRTANQRVDRVSIGLSLGERFNDH